jgi:Fic family protein
MIHRNQQEYYDALNQSTQNADCGVFVEFMLNEILQTMKNRGLTPTTDQVGGLLGAANGAATGAVNDVLIYIEAHPGCRANEIEKALSIPHRSAQRRLATLKNSGKIEFRGASKNGGYWRIEP